MEAQCNFLKSERDVLEHRIEAANKKVEETKQEMRDMENLYSSQNVLSVTHRDDDSKVLHKLKQMELNVELTKQKCEKAEGRVKELESENRQLKGADIRNGALVEERDSLKQRVQQSKQVLNEKNKKVNELSIEVTQLKAHVDKLTDENKKSRSQMEKKDNKIDQMEQKLWEIEEDLKIERQRNFEQKAQVTFNRNISGSVGLFVCLFYCFVLFFLEGGQQSISSLSVSLTMCIWAVVVVDCFDCLSSMNAYSQARALLN